MELLFGIAIGLGIGLLILRFRRREDHPPRVGAVERRATDETNAAIRSSLQAIDLSILLFDSHGTEIYRNPAGQLPDLTRTAQAIVDGEVRDLVSSLVNTDVSSPVEREIELYGPPKTILLARVLPSLVDDARGFVVVIDDVTRERQLDDVRRSFVANVSHELRTPVGAIAVLAETMAASDDPATVAQLGDRLSTAAHRLGDMIEDLLELSRTEAYGEQDSSPIPLEGLFDEVDANLSASCEAAGVALVTAVVPPDLQMMGDRRQIRSALQNLVDNAIKYSEPGGEIRVLAERSRTGLRLSVADEGIGIPESDLDRIFERFYRVDAARRRETGGTGLGLSIVRHVALNHGGEVSAFSVEGEGSTFAIDLPVTALAISAPVEEQMQNG